MPITLLSQRDMRWKDVTLGDTPFTIGKYGCTTTSISMLDSFFRKDFLTPDKLSKKLKYTKDGLLIWESVGKALPFEIHERQKTFDQKKIDEAIKNPKMGVILNVGEGSHWVLATGRFPFSKTFRVVDPWDKKRKMSSAYGNIVGSATFILK